jgi:predicted ABC-type ATPase
MQRTKRLRIFAGPNGSGKSSLYEELKHQFFTGFFINADIIASLLRQRGLIDLTELGIRVSKLDLEKFRQSVSGKSLLKKALKDGKAIDFELIDNFIVDKSKNTGGYEASFIAAFIRNLLIKNNKTFSFETVMSHPLKVDEMQNASDNGYKVYLYFVCINNPEINVSRVANRVDKGGHNVDEDKIRSRYPETLNNLYPAIKITYRTYLFDNSNELKLIAEVYNGKLKLHVDNPPEWFIKYVLVNYV